MRGERDSGPPMPCSSESTSQNLAPIWLPHWPPWIATISRLPVPHQARGSATHTKRGAGRVRLAQGQRAGHRAHMVEERRFDDFATASGTCFETVPPKTQLKKSAEKTFGGNDVSNRERASAAASMTKTFEDNAGARACHAPMHGMTGHGAADGHVAWTPECVSCMCKVQSWVC